MVQNSAVGQEDSSELFWCQINFRLCFGLSRVNYMNCLTEHKKESVKTKKDKVKVVFLALDKVLLMWQTELCTRNYMSHIGHNNILTLIF